MNKIDRIGMTAYNNFGSEMKIVEYRKATDIDIYFPEYNYTSKNRRFDDFQKGKIKCPYEPRVCKVGFVGEGKYDAYENNKKTECYKTWKHMLERCYDENQRYKNPTYTNVSVCKEWLNFQNFAKWYYENYYKIEGEIMCLDKDILSKENKVYSPETCIFIPEKINHIFSGEMNGISKSKSGKWMVRVWINGERKYLGSYEDYNKAFEVYKKAKEKYIKDTIISYKNIIPDPYYSILYDVMYNYKINE